MKKILTILLLVALMSFFLGVFLSSEMLQGQKENISVQTSIAQKTFSSESKTPVSAPEPSTNILFAGDVMLDRAVWHYFKDKGLPSIFSNLDKSVFFDNDLNFVNLEGPISRTEIDDNIDPNNLIFNFPPESIEVLKSLEIGGVSLANNHSLNAGKSGIETTRKMLDDNKIWFVGQQNEFDENSIKRFEADPPISIVGVNFLSSPNLDEILLAIEKEKNEDRFIIIFPHWGNEYQTTSSSFQRDLAYKLVDSGANLIIGSHPHVVQNIEIYNGTPIIYSLGNFVFDQTFSKETQQGLIVKTEVLSSFINVKFLPIKSVHLRPELMGEGDKKILLDKILPQTDQRVSNDTLKIAR